MHILIIAPSAPPKNSAEAMQVGRHLTDLDKHHSITLVTTPMENGWEAEDPSLRLELNNTQVVTVGLPYHHLFKRLLINRWIRDIYVPDADIWLRWKAGEIVRRLKDKPDVIYSRSMPFSAAMLARLIKAKLSIPWIMHLSDPWTDSPYRHLTGTRKIRDQRSEQHCFNAADAVSVTTEGLAEHYRAKYRALKDDIFVSPNVMPSISRKSVAEKSGRMLRIIYTGALYGSRRLTDILKAMNLIAVHKPELLDRITIDFYGNASQDILDEMSACRLPQVVVWGRVSYSEVQEKQAAADVMLSIEPDGPDPLLKTFLPSKILDYIAAGKPVLAITPEDSEAWRLCKRGFGWAVRPGDAQAIAGLFAELADRLASGNDLIDRELSLPVEYSAEASVCKLVTRMRKLVDSDEALEHAVLRQ